MHRNVRRLHLLPSTAQRFMAVVINLLPSVSD